MRTRSRNDEEKHQRREAILDAAMEVFFSKGFEKASMDIIAKKASLSRSLIYVYFKDKLDIHMGLCLRAGQSLLTYMQTYIDKYDKGIDKVHAAGEAYFAFYNEEPKLFKLMSLRLGMLEDLANSEIEPTPNLLEMQKMEDRIMETMVKAIESGLNDGTVNKKSVNSPLQTAMYMRGSMHGLIMLQDTTGSLLFDRAGLDRVELIQYSRDLVTKSLAADK